MPRSGTRERMLYFIYLYVCLFYQDVFKAEDLARELKMTPRMLRDYMRVLVEKGFLTRLIGNPVKFKVLKRKVMRFKDFLNELQK
mgnify:CR=1 FL=1